jgi:hypothetical protein
MILVVYFLCLVFVMRSMLGRGFMTRQLWLEFLTDGQKSTQHVFLSKKLAAQITARDLSRLILTS